MGPSRPNLRWYQQSPVNGAILQNALIESTRRVCLDLVCPFVTSKADATGSPLV
jgi:hypothetical protein